MTEVLPEYDLPSDSKSTCCLDFLTTDAVKMKACGHRFHATCLVTWFQGHSTNEMKRTCPNCRREPYAPERGAVRRFRLEATRTAPSLPAIGNSLQSGSSRSLARTRGTAPLDGQDDEMIPEELIDRVLALEATRNDALQGMRNETRPPTGSTHTSPFSVQASRLNMQFSELEGRFQSGDFRQNVHQPRQSNSTLAKMRARKCTGSPNQPRKLLTHPESHDTAPMLLNSSVNTAPNRSTSSRSATLARSNLEHSDWATHDIHADRSSNTSVYSGQTAQDQIASDLPSRITRSMTRQSQQLSNSQSPAQPLRLRYLSFDKNLTNFLSRLISLPKTLFAAGDVTVRWRMIRRRKHRRPVSDSM
jgi:hypothetical protein